MDTVSVIVRNLNSTAESGKMAGLGKPFQVFVGNFHTMSGKKTFEPVAKTGEIAFVAKIKPLIGPDITAVNRNFSFRRRTCLNKNFRMFVFVANFAGLVVGLQKIPRTRHEQMGKICSGRAFFATQGIMNENHLVVFKTYFPADCISFFALGYPGTEMKSADKPQLLRNDQRLLVKSTIPLVGKIKRPPFLNRLRHGRKELGQGAKSGKFAFVAKQCMAVNMLADFQSVAHRPPILFC